jgi:hypothetical protein
LALLIFTLLLLLPEAIVIAQESAASDLKTYIVEIYKGKVEVDWTFLPDYMGTAEALLKIKHKIKVRRIILHSSNN